MSLLIGCIADDLTGATDLAMILAREGLKTIQVVGVPNADTPIPDADAIVVALKSRTIPADEAIEVSLAACDWLKAAGASQIFFKYCSTFDSTEHGNIGPVTDALMERLNTNLTIACPSFPENGRTVYRGYLFVGDGLLSESSLRNHPLTPMRDANIARVLAQQSQSQVANIFYEQVEQGERAIVDALLTAEPAQNTIFIVDAMSNEHLDSIGSACKDLPLITGGSAVAMGLAGNYRAMGSISEETAEHPFYIPCGNSVVLAGSCSEATLAQIEQARKTMPSYRIDAAALLAGQPVVDEALQWAASLYQQHAKVLIYSSAAPAEVMLLQGENDKLALGSKIESVMGELAKRLCAELDIKRFVVAGGETSGAVIEALNVQTLQIGPAIDPGVPWTKSVDGSDLALALKSGNFGSVDFFEKAIAQLDGLNA